MKKRFLSMLLVLCSLLAMLPAQALAAGGTEQFTNLTPGGTYYFDIFTEVSRSDTLNPVFPDVKATHYVPFTYAGTVEAYSLADAQATPGAATSRSLFVADYVVILQKSWNDLSASNKNLIFGKDFPNALNPSYTLRSLSAGSASYNGGGVGGTPDTNEWDAIFNKSTLIEPIKNCDIYSWGQDTDASTSDNRAMRGRLGYTNAWSSTAATTTTDTVGWRPALEVKNTVTKLRPIKLDFDGGSVDAKSEITIVCAGDKFKAPDAAELIPPERMAFDKWQATDGTTYDPGFDCNYTDMLTATWKLDKFKGSGSVNDPYLIETVADLALLATKVNSNATNYTSAHYKLMNDLDLTNNNPWTPIGTKDSPASPFLGTFDGNNKTISNLTVTVGTCQGLFGDVGKDGESTKATIKNLTVSGGSVDSGLDESGAIAGRATNAIIENCHNINVTVTTDGGQSLGGIVGLNGKDSTVQDCSNSALVTSTSTAVSSAPSPQAGGIVGANNATVTNCANSGEVKVGANEGSASSGGVVGTNVGTMTNCVNNGAVSIENPNPSNPPFGGVTGINTNAVSFCYTNLPTVFGTNDSTGDITGCGTFPGKSGNVTLINDYVDSVKGSITPTTYVPNDSTSLINALNAWADSAEGKAVNANYWKLNAAGYPVPTLTTKPQNAFTVTFDANGGSVSPASAATVGGTLASLPTPTINGSYRFDGWFTAASGGTPVTTATPFLQDSTIYAHWTHMGGYIPNGGADSPNIVVTPPTYVNPNDLSHVTLTLGGNMDASGRASVSVSDKTVSDAITRARAESRGNGVSVELNVDTGGKKADSITANLPKAVQDILVRENVSEFSITSETVDLTLDSKTLQAIQKQSSGDVTINASRVDVGTLSKEAQNRVGNRPVFNLTITGANGESISDFGGGLVTVSIPYTLQPGENSKNLQAYFIDASGEMYEVTCTYDPITMCLVFVTNHFSIYAIGYKENAPKFTDIANHWAEDDIKFVAEHGLFFGTGSNAFSPDLAMTRGMFVTALGRLAGIDSSTYKDAEFTDVKSTDYCFGYVNWAAERGIAQGTTATTFAPNQAISRQEMAVFMTNYAKIMKYTLPQTRTEIVFADNASIANWAAKAVKSMQMAGVIMGKDGNRFDPTGTATRGEVSAVLHRYVELVIGKTRS